MLCLSWCVGKWRCLTVAQRGNKREKVLEVLLFPLLRPSKLNTQKHLSHLRGLAALLIDT